ncbi:hypothetical protein VAWG002_30790 [Aeromonas veronii]|nr:hypothetical protein VAWG002_30790 [Aeromonas veronii]
MLKRPGWRDDNPLSGIRRSLKGDHDMLATTGAAGGGDRLCLVMVGAASGGAWLTPLLCIAASGFMSWSGRFAIESPPPWL